MSSYGSESWESRKLPLGRESLGTPQGVGKVGVTSLVASLSGRLTAFHPPDHKAGGSRHCDGGAHGGEICWESRMLPLGRESLGTPHGVPPPRSQSRRVPSSRRGCSRWRYLLGKSEVTPWSRVSRDASGRPSWDASRRSTPQITKPVGHGGEICPSREPDDPLASQQPCRGLLGPEALPLVGRAPGCDLSDPSQVMEPKGPNSHTAMAMDPVHGNQSSFGSTDVTLTAQ